MEDQDFLLFVKKVKDYTSIDLAQYKEAQMKRRLTTLRTKKVILRLLPFLKR